MLYKRIDGDGYAYISGVTDGVLGEYLKDGDWEPASRRERIKFAFRRPRFSIIEAFLMTALAVLATYVVMR
jgi:hypothetical protein